MPRRFPEKENRGGRQRPETQPSAPEFLCLSHGIKTGTSFFLGRSHTDRPPQTPPDTTRHTHCAQRLVFSSLLLPFFWPSIVPFEARRRWRRREAVVERPPQDGMVWTYRYAYTPKVSGLQPSRSGQSHARHFHSCWPRSSFLEERRSATLRYADLMNGALNRHVWTCFDTNELNLTATLRTDSPYERNQHDDDDRVHHPLSCIVRTGLPHCWRIPYEDKPSLSAQGITGCDPRWTAVLIRAVVVERVTQQIRMLVYCWHSIRWPRYPVSPPSIVESCRNLSLVGLTL